MSPAERSMLRTLIDRARRAQLDAAGGYRSVEADAKGHDLTLSRLTPLELAAWQGTIATSERTAGNQRVDVDQARLLRAKGWSYPRVARELGCSHHAVMWACDENFRQRRLQQMRAYRLARKEAA